MTTIKIEYNRNKSIIYPGQLNILASNRIPVIIKYAPKIQLIIYKSNLNI